MPRKLPIAALALTAVGVAQLPRVPERVVVRPFFELRLDSGRVFTESDYAPLFSGIVDLVAERFGVPAGRDKERLSAVWKSLAWPVDVKVAIEHGTDAPLASIAMPRSGASLLDSLVPLSSGELTEGTAVNAAGAGWRQRSLSVADVELIAYEAVVEARRVLVFGPASAFAKPKLTLEAMARLRLRRGPAAKQLRARAASGDVGFVFDYRSMLAALNRAAGGAAGLVDSFVIVALRMVVGPRFSGVAGRASLRDGKLSLELFADIGPGQGWLGTGLNKAPRAIEVARWIPPGVSDYFALDTSTSGLRRLLSASLFGFVLEPGEFHEDLRWLTRGDALELLDDYLTGAVFAASEIGIETQFQSAADLKGWVVGVAASDGLGLVARLRKLLAERENAPPDTGVQPSPTDGPGVHRVVWRGETLMFLAAHKDLVLAAQPDEAGATLLRKCLATVGRGNEPQSGDRVATAFGRGRVLRYVLASLRMSELDAPAPDDQGLAGVVAGFLATRDKPARWRIMATRSGTTLRIDF